MFTLTLKTKGQREFSNMQLNFFCIGCFFAILALAGMFKQLSVFTYNFESVVE